LKNGLTLILDRMAEVNSVAYSLLIPGGIAHDTPDLIGESLVISDLLHKGAGSYDSHSLSNEFDYHAISHGEGASFTYFSLNGSCIAEKLPKGLELLSLLALKAHLPSEYLNPIKSVLLQDIESLGDNPARLCMVELSRRYYPIPYSYPSMGTAEGLSAVTHSAVLERYKRTFRPGGSALSIAGRFDIDETVAYIEKLFSEWTGSGEEKIPFDSLQPFASHFIHSDSNQTQIALAFPSAKFSDPDYYTAKIAHQILSGGMFGRLFLEVREKKGLCYSVSARHSANKEYGTTIVYAGTTPERAKETLETIEREFIRVGEDIEQVELDRAIANQLSSVFLSEDSSGARASSNVGDWWLGGRVRPTSEVEEAFQSVSLSDLKHYFEKYTATPRTMVVVGREPLS
jgi:predicted Zn-dependent peptidase